MTRTEILYLLPYIGSLVLSLGVLFFAWQRRSTKGVNAYLWYMAGQTFWVLGYILELINPGLSGKIYWDSIQWLARLLMAVAFPIFAIQYTELKLNHPNRSFVLYMVFPLIFTFIVLTYNLHELIYINPHLSETIPFSELIYDFGWSVYVFAIYVYGTAFWGMGLLIRRLFFMPKLYRTQLATIIIGFLIPLFGAVLRLLGVQVGPQKDLYRSRTHSRVSSSHGDCSNTDYSKLSQLDVTAYLKPWWIQL